MTRQNYFTVLADFPRQLLLHPALLVWQILSAFPCISRFFSDIKGFNIGQSTKPDGGKVGLTKNLFFSYKVTHFHRERERQKVYQERQRQQQERQEQERRRQEEEKRTEEERLRTEERRRLSQSSSSSSSSSTRWSSGRSSSSSSSSSFKSSSSGRGQAVSPPPPPPPQTPATTWSDPAIFGPKPQVYERRFVIFIFTFLTYVLLSFKVHFGPVNYDSSNFCLFSFCLMTFF